MFCVTSRIHLTLWENSPSSFRTEARYKGSGGPPPMKSRVCGSGPRSEGERPSVVSGFCRCFQAEACFGPGLRPAPSRAWCFALSATPAGGIQVFLCNQPRLTMPQLVSDQVTEFRCLRSHLSGQESPGDRIDASFRFRDDQRQSGRFGYCHGFLWLVRLPDYLRAQPDRVLHSGNNMMPSGITGGASRTLGTNPPRCLERNPENHVGFPTTRNPADYSPSARAPTPHAFHLPRLPFPLPCGR